MRLTIRILGIELIDLEITQPDAGPSPTQDPGDCTTYPVGFVARMDRPHEMDTPDRDW